MRIALFVGSGVLSRIPPRVSHGWFAGRGTRTLRRSRPGLILLTVPGAVCLSVGRGTTDPAVPRRSSRRFTATVLPSIPEHRVLGRRVLVKEVRRTTSVAEAYDVGSAGVMSR